ASFISCFHKIISLSIKRGIIFHTLLLKNVKLLVRTLGFRNLNDHDFYHYNTCVTFIAEFYATRVRIIHLPYLNRWILRHKGTNTKLVLPYLLNFTTQGNEYKTCVTLPAGFSLTRVRIEHLRYLTR